VIDDVEHEPDEHEVDRALEALAQRRASIVVELVEVGEAVLAAAVKNTAYGLAE
jgi:hypothetical protein